MIVLEQVIKVIVFERFVVFWLKQLSWKEQGVVESSSVDFVDGCRALLFFIFAKLYNFRNKYGLRSS